MHLIHRGNQSISLRRIGEPRSVARDIRVGVISCLVVGYPVPTKIIEGSITGCSAKNVIMKATSFRCMSHSRMNQ